MPITISSRRPTCLTADHAGTVRRFFAAWTTGDLQAMLALVAPQVEIEPLLGVLYEREIYLGPAGIAHAVRELAQRWDRFEIGVEDAQQTGEQVIAQVHVAVEKYGMSCEGHVTVVCTLRDGLIVSLTEDEQREPESVATSR